MVNKMGKDFKPLAKAAQRQGWLIEQSRKHLKWRSPSGSVVFSSISPSDVHAVDQHLRQLIKHGFTVSNDNDRHTAR